MNKVNILTDNHSIKSYIINSNTKNKIIKSKKRFVSFCEDKTNKMVTINIDMITSIEVYDGGCVKPVINRNNLIINNIELTLIEVQKQIHRLEQRFEKQDLINQELSIRQDERSKVYNNLRGR